MPADEFEVIRACFAPHATDVGARALLDDAAVIECGGAVVVTTDTIVEHVHFLPGDPIETIALKALRVNVSDLVAKGAQPWGAFLNLTWPSDRPADEIAIFAAALGRDLDRFGMSLLGGDTSSTGGPLVVSMTVLGRPLGAVTPSRAGAKPGDDIWLVGGEIGSALLGLRLRTGRLALGELRAGRAPALNASYEEQGLAANTPQYLRLPGGEFDAEAAWLMSIYLAPLVRSECAAIVARYAHASIDVSDGLVADAAKLAKASAVRLRLSASSIPLSIPAQRWVLNGGDMRELFTGGDDYIVLFTASARERALVSACDANGDLRLSRVGAVEVGEGVIIEDDAARPLDLGEAGHTHRLGR